MDSEDSESVKDRPPQIDVKSRPGPLGLSGNKASEESEQDGPKSLYEKMLEDETEKENRRRQVIDYGFVLGTPTDESDGTILFNYDEPPRPVQQEDGLQDNSYNMDSDSTLNNTLRRAIREQQDRGNKVFMEGTSPDSSVDSGVSVMETEPSGDLEANEQDLSHFSMTDSITQQSPVAQQNGSETLVSKLELRSDEQLSPIPQAEVGRVETGQENTSTTTETKALQQQYHLLIQQKSPQERILQQHLIHQQRQDVLKQPASVVAIPSSNNTPDPELTPSNIPQSNTGKAKKMGFFKRFFSSKKHE